MRNFLMIGLFSALIGTAGDAAAASLSDLQWQYRVIVVFAPTDTQAGEFRDTLENTAGVAERDIAWFVLSPTDGTFSNIEQRVSRNALLELRDNDGIEAVLIGKDGGVKARQSGDFDINAFFGEIDQMPMRRNEVQQ